MIFFKLISSSYFSYCVMDVILWIISELIIYIFKSEGNDARMGYSLQSIILTDWSRL